MTPAQAKARYMKNLSDGQKIVLDQLKTKFEVAAEHHDLTLAKRLCFTIDLNSVKKLKHEAVKTACELFEDYLNDEGWEFAVKMQHAVPDSCINADIILSLYGEDEILKKKRASRYEIIDQLAKLGVKTFNEG